MTGGSRSIGCGVVEELTTPGYAVVVGYGSNHAEAEQVVAAAEAKGTRAVAVAADVADEDAVSRLFDTAETTFGGVDVVVNAVGVMTLAPLADFDLAALDRMHRTNIRILAHELRGRDVTVNAVAPGPTATGMFLEGKDEAALARFANAVPLERLGTPADIASVVAFLASPAGHWINGQTIRANGGIN